LKCRFSMLFRAFAVPRETLNRAVAPASIHSNLINGP